jgi:hypothetical protein
LRDGFSLGQVKEGRSVVVQSDIAVHWNCQRGPVLDAPF